MIRALHDWSPLIKYSSAKILYFSGSSFDFEPIPRWDINHKNIEKKYWRALRLPVSIPLYPWEKLGAELWEKIKSSSRLVRRIVDLWRMRLLVRRPFCHLYLDIFPGHPEMYEGGCVFIYKDVLVNIDMFHKGNLYRFVSDIAINLVFRLRVYVLCNNGGGWIFFYFY